MNELSWWLDRTRLAALAIDATLVGLAWWFAYLLRFNFDVPLDFETPVYSTAFAVAGVYAVVGLACGVYAQVWRLTSFLEIRRLAFAVVASGLVVAAAAFVLRELATPRSVVAVHPLLCLVALAGARAAARMLGDRDPIGAPDGAPLLVVGDLEYVAQALRALKGSTQWRAAGVVSPQIGDQGKRLGSVPVVGGLEQIERAVRDHEAKGLLVAAPAGSAARRDAMLASGGHGLPVLTLPSADDLLVGRSFAPRQVRLEDLLGRPSVALDQKALSELFAGRCVMVTGGAGSIGSELCRQLARFGVQELVVADASEVGLYQIDQELSRAHPQLKLYAYTGNVREYGRLLAIAQTHQPTVVLHAAAYKHVPLMEERNEVEALRTNVMGTQHAARAAGAVGAQRFVMISTDKAVNPTNVMGASKRLAEMMVQAVSREYPQTQYVSVRFGNVLGSSGSVVPLFTEQIAKGGPVTVTHPDIVRYFMTIPEAAQLVLQAGFMGKSGQIFVLDMGEPMKIVELARIMIRLSGKTEEEIPIAFTGLRPGEKLFEELLANDETTEPTPHPKLRVAKRGARDEAKIDEVLAWIEAAGPNPDPQALRHWLKGQVPEYQPRFA
jgi:FlaA1/EpsC-like NDP-sugar epimerase